MRYTLVVNSFFAALLMCSVSCGQEKNSINRFKFSNAEINGLLSLLRVSPDTIRNFHIRYSEHLNDSSAIITIWQNQKKPTEDLTVCDILNYEGSNVFVYDTVCNFKVPEQLKSKDQQSPFYIPDSGFWEVLAMRRKGEITYYKISFFINNDQNMEDPFSEYAPDR